MAQIDFTTAQIIVENAMRNNGYGGTLTIGTQSINLEPSWTTQNPINYQTLRDTIAKSIVDALTATDVSGSVSEGLITSPNGQVVTSSEEVNINTIDPTKGAARLNDSITISAISDPVFLTWMQAVGSYCSAPAPASVTGKITSASSTVRIGD